MKFWAVITVCLLLVTLYQGGSAQQCGQQLGGALCSGGLCCSQWGYCGNTDPYCGDGCQSQCDGGSGGGGGGGGGGGSTGPIAELISEETFEEMLLHRNDAACPGRGFYTYDAFISASNKFPEFGNTGDNTTRKREIAAFLAQTSHETTGGWATAPDGPYSWGYCFKSEVNAGSDYCAPHPLYPCVPGKKYYGRGPIQLSWNYNYGQAGTDLGLDLLTNPDLVTSDPTLSFETAFWFWMTPQSPKPSCHDVITNNWIPSPIDLAANRKPGFGVTTNIINGGLECGFGPDARVESRIGFYKRYCDILGIDYGDNLDCNNQRPFNNLLSKVNSI